MRAFLLLFFTLNFSLIFACKCNGEPNIKTSFQNADFVFIGEIYDFVEVPAGYNRFQNILSKVKIDKILKSDESDEYYTKDATIFGSPLHSCDVLFDQSGKFLIFAYYETDTGLLYSNQCFVRKKYSELTKDELKELEKLSSEYKDFLKVENSNSNKGEILILDEKTPNRKINELKKEIQQKENKNSNYKLIIYGLTFLIILLITLFTIKMKRKNCS